MLNRISNRSRLFMLLCFLAYLAGVAGYVLWENGQARKILYSHLDRSLFLAANSLRFMVAPDFHDRVVDENSISYAEEMKNREAFNSFSKETDYA